MVPLNKKAHGAFWVLIFHHNIAGGYFNTSNQLNILTEHKYSVLGILEKYRINGEFEFLLEYPEISGYNRFKQTSNPVTTYNNVTGFVGKHLSWTKYSFAGLAQSTATSCTFIDGSPGVGTWFYAIGQRDEWDEGVIAGPMYKDKGDIPLNEVNLWVRVLFDSTKCFCNSRKSSLNLFLLVLTLIS